MQVTVHIIGIRFQIFHGNKKSGVSIFPGKYFVTNWKLWEDWQTLWAIKVRFLISGSFENAKQLFLFYYI